MTYPTARRLAPALAALTLAACQGGVLPPGIEIRAQPALVMPGEATTLSWSGTHLAGCTASGSWSGPRASSGTLTVTPGATDGLYRLACTGTAGPVTGALRVQVVADPAPALPLRATPGARYLSDAGGTPVLLQGDTAWSLIAATRRADVERYLDDRRARGFNAVLVNLIEHKFARGAPANAYGDAPFRIPGGFDAPNDAYFAYADWVIGSAERRGITVFLVPGYLGYGGGDEGWYRELAASTPAVRQAYGRYVGERLRAHRNIVWVFGGDYNPPERAVVTDIAAGVAAAVPLGLATVHCAAESSPAREWAAAPWLTLNNAYSYGPIGGVTAALIKASPLPLVLIESRYEGEPGGSPQRARAQAYAALLSGAAGQFFGMSPLWHFNGPGNFPSSPSWQQGLASPGSQSMTWLGRILRAQRWWLLQPAPGLIANGNGMGYARASAAMASDGSFALLYLPSRRRLRLALARLAGTSLEGRWIDPSSAAMSSRAAFVAAPAQPVELAARPANTAGGDDWLLLVSAR